METHVERNTQFTLQVIFDTPLISPELFWSRCLTAEFVLYTLKNTIFCATVENRVSSNPSPEYTTQKISGGWSYFRYLELMAYFFPSTPMTCYSEMRRYVDKDGVMKSWCKVNFCMPWNAIINDFFAFSEVRPQPSNDNQHRFMVDFKIAFNLNCSKGSMLCMGAFFDAITRDYITHLISRHLNNFPFYFFGYLKEIEVIPKEEEIQFFS